jgi:hypothetical protein
MDKFHLLRLAVVQRGRAGDGIKMKFVEGFFGDGGAKPSAIAMFMTFRSHATSVVLLGRLDFIHVAGQQFDFGVFKRLAALLFIVIQPTRSTKSPFSGETRL